MNYKGPDDLFKYNFHCEYRNKMINRNYCINCCKTPYKDNCFIKNITKQIIKENPNVNTNILNQRLKTILPFKNFYK